jgi:hypothetical protein
MPQLADPMPTYVSDKLSTEAVTLSAYNLPD